MLLIAHLRCIAVFAFAGFAASSALGEAVPYPTPFGKAGKSYSVSVGGKDVPVKTAWKGRCRVARFSMDKPAEVTISVGKPVAAYEVRPRWAKVRGKVDGDKLVLTFDEPYAVRVVVNDNPPLALFGYPKYEKPTGKDVVTITDEQGVDASGKTDMTALLQGVIDRVSKAGGGTIYFPDGTYGGSDKAELFLKSNVTLHLAPGAMIRQMRFLLNDVENVKIVGHGVLDFTGSPRGNQEGCLRGNSAKKVLIDGLISLNFDYNWNTRFDMSQDVMIRNYRIFGGKDGIDPVDSQRITMRHVYIITSDDCIATKSFRGGAEEVSDILAEYALLRCLKYGGVKIGTETNAARFRNITYRHIDMVSGMRAAIIQLRDGAKISNVTIEDLTCDLAWGRAIDFVIEKRRGLGTIENVTVRDVNLRQIDRVKDHPRIAGYDKDHTISKVTFENLIVEGEPITEAKQASFLIEHAADIRFVTTKKRAQVPGLSEALAGQSEAWAKGEHSAAKLVDGNSDTTALSSEEKSYVEFAFEKAKTLTALRVLGGNKYGAIGVGLAVQEGENWRIVTDYRHCQGQGWTELAIEPTRGQRFRVTFRKSPDVSNCQVSELRLYEALGISDAD